MPTISLENIFYFSMVIIFLIILIVLVKLLSSKKSTQENQLQKELEKERKKNIELEESLTLLEKEMRKLDATTKTSYISDQLDKVKLMEDEVLKYKQRVKEAKSIAQEAMSVKYEFLSNIRHEIRTPMNSIIAFSDMLVHDLKDITHISYANNILISGRKLLVLMDDIIELSRLETGAFDIHTTAVDIRLLFNSTVQDFQKSANAKGLELILNIDDALPESLILDDKKVKDILSNLIDNAIKFTLSGYVDIHVKVDRFHVVNNTVDISMIVKDSGMGIESSNFQTIFEIFEKRDDANEVEFQGTGLGLSIHRKMARMMDGDIVVESTLNEGSTFIFSLKSIEIVLLSADENIDESSIDFTLIKPDGATIMVIDEHSDSREIIEEAFRYSSVEIVTFNNPRDAIESLKEKSVDMIFIDVNILSIDDNAVSKVIAKMSSAPVVSLTTISLKEVSFVEDGANIVGHLKKPISKLELFKITLKTLNSSHFMKGTVLETVESNEFADIDEETLKIFKQEHQATIEELYKKAESTNDLGAIKVFAESLFKLTYRHKITILSDFATELLSKIELFDIEKINSMMSEYKLKLKRIQNL